MVFAMAKLKQPIFRHGPVAVGGGTIQANACRLQVIHAQRVLIQGPLADAPARIVAQGLQHGRQPVIADIQCVHRLPGALPQRVEPLFGPGGDMVQPMVGLRKDMGQPDHADPAQAEAHPVAMGGKMLVQQSLYPHPLQLGQQQGNIIDTFRGQGQALGHPARSLRLAPRLRPPHCPSRGVAAGS
jgi:hypothetical protein